MRPPPAWRSGLRCRRCSPIWAETAAAALKHDQSRHGKAGGLPGYDSTCATSSSRGAYMLEVRRRKLIAKPPYVRRDRVGDTIRWAFATC